jgi:hypothetical protein
LLKKLNIKSPCVVLQKKLTAKRSPLERELMGDPLKIQRT